MQEQAQAQQDQISRAGGPIMHVPPWWYLQLRPDQLVLVLLRQAAAVGTAPR